MSRIIEVLTPEQVPIRYELAGFGSRALAALIDYGVLLLVFLLLVLAFAFFHIFGLAFGGDMSDFAARMGESVVIGVFTLIVFLLTWGYYIGFETLWNGATPGKRVMGLRVIKDGGHPVDFRAVLIRNLLRAVDLLPGVPLLPVYGLAFVTVLSNTQYKRLGDLAAGTLVVRHERESDEPRYRPGFGDAVVFRLLEPTALSQLSRLTRDEYRMVQRFLDRRTELPQPLRGEFARRLAAPLMQKLAYQPPALGWDDERWLDELDLAYRTRAFSLAAAPADTRKW
ncbi:MAG TPA: RDD family protein [Armatimonadota bacterium]|jgi:uncharacterized RDD family membrane protein YckC